VELISASWLHAARVVVGDLLEMNQSAGLLAAVGVVLISEIGLDLCCFHGS